MHNSKIVTTNQKGIHPNLEKVLCRYSLKNYKRPASDFSKESLAELKSWVRESDKLILDLGCGTGESSYLLAEKNPSCKVLGLDKSYSRIHRKNDFKQDNEKVKLMRAELLDFIPLLHQTFKRQISKIYILYPNPWPKSIHYKRRFHFNPVMPFLCDFTCPIELRSNWKLYLEEFAKAYEFYNKKESKPRELALNNNFLTPFEKKYFLSGQKIYQLEIT